MPGYQAGVPTGQAPEAIAAGGIAQLASNESPFPPHPQVVEAIAARGDGDEPLPRPRRDPAAPAHRRALRDRARPRRRRQRLLRDPARRRRGALRARRRDPLRLARLLDVPVPAGADRRPRDPRAAGRRRRPRPRGDGGRGHRRDPAAARLQPEQPDRDPHPGGRDRRLLRADPAARDGDPRRGLRRVPDRRRPRRHPRPARRLPQPGRPPHLQQVLRPGRAAGRLRDRLRRASAPRSTPCASRSASTPSPRRPGRRRSCTRTTSCAGSRATVAERLRVEEGAARARPRTSRDPGQLLLDRPRRRRGGRGRRRPRRARDRRPSRNPARRPRPHPRQLRHRGGERPLPRGLSEMLD